MRFMMLMLPGGEPTATGDWGDPPAGQGALMNRYNEELVQAGVLLAADGLEPPSQGARVTLSGGAKRVVDGPFAQARETVGGYWILDVKSRAEAVEWASRVPLAEGDVVELRQVREPDGRRAEDGSAATPSREPSERARGR